MTPWAGVQLVARPLLVCLGWLWDWRSWWNERFCQGKPKFSEKTYPDATLSTTNPTYQTRARTWVAAVGSQRLTASAMARPPIHLYTIWYSITQINFIRGNSMTIQADVSDTSEVRSACNILVFVPKWKKRLRISWWKRKDSIERDLRGTVVTVRTDMYCFRTQFCCVFFCEHCD
jgi:hypothetical protein